MLKSVKKATEENEHRQKESIINQMISPLVSIRNKLGVTAMSAAEYTLESLIPKSNVRELFDLTDAKNYYFTQSWGMWTIKIIIQSI